MMEICVKFASPSNASRLLYKFICSEYNKDKKYELLNSEGYIAANH